MKNEYIKTFFSTSINELTSELINEDTGLFIFFFGSAIDSNSIQNTVKYKYTIYRLYGCWKID
jgi:hypothetical protein